MTDTKLDLGGMERRGRAGFLFTSAEILALIAEHKATKAALDDMAEQERDADKWAHSEMELRVTAEGKLATAEAELSATKERLAEVEKTEDAAHQAEAEAQACADTWLNEHKMSEARAVTAEARLARAKEGLGEIERGLAEGEAGRSNDWLSRVERAVSVARTTLQALEQAQ